MDFSSQTLHIANTLQFMMLSFTKFCENAYEDNKGPDQILVC